MYSKKFLKLIPYFLVSISINTISQTWAQNIYTIEKISPNGLITVSLSVPVNTTNNKNTQLSLRDDIPVTKSQVINVRCGQTKLKHDKSGNWLLPTTCNKVTWQVKPELSDNKPIDLANQLTLKLKKVGWILFSESSSLLRIKHSESASVLTSTNNIPLLGATSTLYGWAIPPVGTAPEFYIIGQPETQQKIIADLPVTYVIDNPQQTNWSELQALHQKTLRYFTTILSLPADLPSNEKSLLLIWLGTEAKNKQVNGAAGRRSFIANYVYERNHRISTSDNMHSLLVIAHEQFHQYADMVRYKHPVDTSVWIEESLAQYYALKSMQKALSADEFEAIKNKFLSQDQNIYFKFSEIEQQIKENNYKNYSLLYSQGPKFWYAMDQALLSSSQGKYGLDSLLPVLINSDCQNGQLPAAFVQKTNEIGGNQINNLLKQYVQ
ncbi:MAG: hypothetical protein ACRCR8_03535 [Snodgrassella alvi]